MQKRVVFVSAAAAWLGLAVTVLGFVSESARSKAFVGYDGQHCVYRRTAAFGCGIAAAALVLAGMVIITAASGCFGRYGGRATAPGRRRTIAVNMSNIAWFLVLVAAMLFLYGAWRNSGGTTGLTRTRTRYNRTYYYGCRMLRAGIFATASVASAVTTACAIAAYANLHSKEPEPRVAMGQPQWQPHPYPPSQFAAPGVAMGQLYPPSQFSEPGAAMGQPPWPPQPYPSVVYPAPPHHGYGVGKQPPGPA